MQITTGGSVASPTMGAWRAQMERNAFKGLDADSNGAIGLDEFKAGLQNVPAGRSGPASPAGTGGAEAAFDAIDTDSDGRLSDAELTSAMRGRSHHRRVEAQDQSQARGMLGSIGSFLTAQLLGQDQPATASTTSGGGAGQGDAADLSGEVRRLLMRYAATHTATATASGLAAA